MDTYPPGRRDFLKTMTALGAAGLPVVVPALGPGAVFSADAAARSRAEVAYDPAAQFEIKVSEVEFRRNAAGRMLMARIYQPDGAGTVSHHARSARRRVERQGPLRGGTDGPRAGGQRRAGGRHRHDAGAGSAVPGVRAGRELRRALAQMESGLVERRPVEDRHLRQLQRRPRRRAPGHAPARCALQRDSAARGAERRCDGGLHRDALADQRPVRALPECGENEARGHDQEQHDLLQAVGNDLRIATRSRSSNAANRSRWCRC